MGRREFARVLARIKPGKESERSERLFIKRVMGRLGREVPRARIVLAGSFAKGTFLEGDRDVDIFVLFAHSVEKGAMEGIVRAAVENAFPGAFFQVAYAQHPYVRLFLEGRKIDVVPAYEVSCPQSPVSKPGTGNREPRIGGHLWLRSPVDRSQLHTEYVLSKMSPRQRDEVRLLKKLLKANLLYGAEIKVQGFSGYLCELLILKYGTFMNALRAVSGWGERTFICVEGRMNQEEALAKFDTPLVAIDPVDPERNVAAVVSRENYAALVALARTFLRSKNRPAFFEPRKFSPAQLRTFAKPRNLYCVSFRAPEIVDDVLWGQVRRYSSALFSLLSREGFELMGHAMDRCGEEVCIVFELLSRALPENRMVMGPPLALARDCLKFAARHVGSFILGGRLAASVRRKERTMEGMLGRIRALPLPSRLQSAKHAKLFKCAKAIGKCRPALERYASMRLIVG